MFAAAAAKRAVDLHSVASQVLEFILDTRCFNFCFICDSLGGIMAAKRSRYAEKANTVAIAAYTGAPPQ